MTAGSNDTFILSQYRVWVMRPVGNATTGYTYPWDWSRWSLQKQLIVKRFSPKAGGMGVASLELLRQTRQDEHDPLSIYHANDVVVPRAWVAISIADPDAPDDINTIHLDIDAIEWWGFLGDLPGTIVEGTTERIGLMQAKEIGHLLDDISLGSFSLKSATSGRLTDDMGNAHGWCQASSDGSQPVPVNTPPTANIRTKDGDVIGNAKYVTGGYNLYVFARLPSDCGTSAGKFFTRWRLSQHIVKFCKPLGLPPITIAAGLTTSSSTTQVMHVQSVQPGSYRLATPPGSPSTGDSYHVDTGATGAWSGQDGNYAQWDGAAWVFTTTDPSPSKPTAGDSYLVDSGGTHEWAGKDQQVATWDGNQWLFASPADGTDLAVTSDGSHRVKTTAGDGTVTWPTNDLVNYLDDTTTPEVYELRNLKYRGALEMLFPFTQGLDYKFAIGTDKASWVINVYSASDTADYGVPAATLEEANLVSCEAVEVNLSPALADRPDEVVFEGAACLFGFSLSYQNRNLINRWTADLILDYDDANDFDRGQPQYDDIYTLFQAEPNASGDLRRSNTPGDTATDDGPLIPNVIWDGTTAKLGTTSRCPYLPCARFTDLIPWEGGRKSDGTDTRDDTRKAQPSYLKPKVFYYESSLSTHKWADMTDARPGANTFGVDTPEVSADDRAACLRIRFTPKHALARDDFDGISVDGKGVIDWRNLIATIAMPSDQRVRVVKRRQVNGADIDDANVMTRLTIRDETLGFWCMLKGTVIGLKFTAGDIAPDRITATNVPTDGGGDEFGYSIRNDWAKVERNALRLAAWAFRDRSAGTLALARPDVRPSWLRIGAMIGVVKEAPDDTGADISHTANALIRSYDVMLDDAPRIVVSLETLPMPTFIKGIGPTSPASGGAVSPSMGGTVPQAVQQLQSRVGTLEVGSQRKIIYPALNRPGDYDLGFIGGGNDISPSGYTGIKKIATTLSTIATYDPTAFPSTADGIGWGWHSRLNQWVLMLHDVRSGVAHDLPVNAPVFMARTGIAISGQICYLIALT